MHPFPLRWYCCCSFMLPRQPVGHVPHLPQFIIVRLLRKARLLFFQFGLSIMHYTVANLNLFRWISGEVKSYFLVQIYGTASTFFRKCRWTIRKYRLCLFTPESSFFWCSQKEYSGINYLLPSYPIKNIRIFLFLQAQKEYSYIFSWLPQSLFLIEAP